MANQRRLVQTSQLTETTSEPITFETAIQRACRNVPVVGPANTMTEIKTLLWNGAYEIVSHIVVCIADKFVGILRIEDVLRAAGDQVVPKLMDSDAPRVGPDTDREVAAWKATQHGESALAVVSDAGQFMGLIPPYQMLRILLAEHEEDLARLGGFLRQTSIARVASEESISRRFLYRCRDCSWGSEARWSRLTSYALLKRIYRKT